MYAKLEDGHLRPAPRHITVDGQNIWNAPADMMLAQGYKKVVYTEAPEAPEGFYYETHWEEKEETIEQAWDLVELPDEIDDAEAYGIIFGGE